MNADDGTLFDFDSTCRVCGGEGRVWDERIGAERMCECRAQQLLPPDTNPVAPAGIDGREDEVRLNRQQAMVWAIVSDEQWHTIEEIAGRAQVPAQSVSARLRDLRKPKYGGHEVERRNLGNGLHSYRLIRSAG